MYTASYLVLSRASLHFQSSVVNAGSVWQQAHSEAFCFTKFMHVREFLFLMPLSHAVLFAVSASLNHRKHADSIHSSFHMTALHDLTEASPLNTIDSHDQITNTAVQSFSSETTTNSPLNITLSSCQNITLPIRPEPRWRHNAQQSVPSTYRHPSLQQYHRLTSLRHDFSSTFDVRVGQLPGNLKRFTVHTDIFTQRSKFLAAARKPEWIAGDATKPVDLERRGTRRLPSLFELRLRRTRDARRGTWNIRA